MINKRQIIKTALKTVEVEIDTLKDLRKEINEKFANCVTDIYNSKGRVVVTGVGKSALIGQNMVGTLNSTGTPSLYMHAADAIHGDLGMIAEEDIIICLSKSGETAEIKVLLPILKNFGNLLIGITSAKKSYLGRHADHVLITPVTKEADPNLLAPTASSVAQLSLGHALASALLKLRGFSHANFAKFHPGGSLGKQLYLKVKDVYINNERPVVKENTAIKDVILEMTTKRLGVAVVLTKEDRISGIITDGDLRRMLNKYLNINKLKARDVMSSDPKTIHPDALAVDAFHLMQNNNITQIVVECDKEYLGVVHIHDLIDEGMV